MFQRWFNVPAWRSTFNRPLGSLLEKLENCFLHECWPKVGLRLFIFTIRFNKILIIKQTYFTKTVVSIEAFFQCISLKRCKWSCFHVPTTQLCTPSSVILDKPWKAYTMNVHVVLFFQKLLHIRSANTMSLVLRKTNS